jgi:hypothetical protein
MGVPSVPGAATGAAARDLDHDRQLGQLRAVMERQAIALLAMAIGEAFRIAQHDDLLAPRQDRIDTQLEVVALCRRQQRRVDARASDVLEHRLAARLLHRHRVAQHAVDVHRHADHAQGCR